MAGAGVRTHEVGSVPFAVLPFDAAVDEVVRRATNAEPTAVHFANAYTIALADNDVSYSGLFATAEALNFTDGMPVSWVGRRAYGYSAEQWPRVYGPDVMQAVLGRDTGLGATTCCRAVTRNPCRVAACHCTTLSAGTDRRGGITAVPALGRAGADGPGPAHPGLRSAGRVGGAGDTQTGLEVARLAAITSLVALAVGAAFDFVAGTKSQAPLWMQRSGTEWAFRLVHEPRRLARRYLWGNPRFLMAAARNPGLRRG